MYDETEHKHSLVSSEDVNGTAVYGSSGDQVGTVDHLMIDKNSGKVAYAVIAFGGFLGLNQSEYSIPWGKLTYDRDRDAYTTTLSKEQVQGAPEPGETWYADRDWEQRTFDYYRVPYYWI